MIRIAVTERTMNPIAYLFFIRTTPFLVQVLADFHLFIQMFYFRVFNRRPKGRDSVR